MKIPCPKCGNPMKIIARTENHGVLVAVSFFCPQCQRIDSLMAEDYFFLTGKEREGEREWES